MAIYHMSVKAVSRGGGRGAPAASAYRAGELIKDQRTGVTHDYRRRSGVVSTDLVLPAQAPQWAHDRSQLWNAAELAEKRKDACVAREIEVSLPEELSPDARRQLALDFAKELATREGCAVDVAIHSSSRQGDARNHHAHLLRTTRVVGPDGFGAKLATEQAGRKRSADLVALRTRWAELSNERLQQAGLSVRIDARSLKDQGLERPPQFHLGAAATALERKTGQPSELRQRWEALNNGPERQRLSQDGQETQIRIRHLKRDIQEAHQSENEPQMRMRSSGDSVRLAQIKRPLSDDVQARLQRREQENTRRLAELAAIRRQAEERLERLAYEAKQTAYREQKAKEHAEQMRLLSAKMDAMDAERLSSGVPSQSKPPEPQKPLHVPQIASKEPDFEM